MATSSLITALVRAIAGDRRPGCPLFGLTAEQASAETNVRSGDLVVYVQSAPRPGEAVVWTGSNGQRHLGRIDKSGRVRAEGDLQRPAQVRGVIVVAISEIKSSKGCSCDE